MASAEESSDFDDTLRRVCGRGWSAAVMLMKEGASGAVSGRRPAVFCVALVAIPAVSVLLTVLLTMLVDGRLTHKLTVRVQVGDKMCTGQLTSNFTRSPSQPRSVETNTSQIRDTGSKQRQSSVIPPDPAPIYATTNRSRTAKADKAPDVGTTAPAPSVP